MKIFIRIESLDHPRFNEFATIRNSLEKHLNILAINNNYGGSSIENEFHTVIRIYPKKRFEDYPEVYKPVAKFNKKKKSAIITFDVILEQIQSETAKNVFDVFKIGIKRSILKLPELKVNDVDIVAILKDLEEVEYESLS